MSTENINKEHIKLVYDLSKSISEDYFEYFYRGNFTTDITQNIMSLTDGKFTQDKDTKKIKKRISFIMIECLQNITRHQTKPRNISVEDTGLFALQKTEDKVLITTSNIVSNKQRNELEKYLDEITSLSIEKLKDTYKKILANGAISKKGGAGLGLISMARRTGGRLHYKFRRINDKYSYFYLQNILYTKDPVEEIPKNELFSTDRISNFHDFLNKENILLNFNGAFAFNNLESILPILQAQKIGGNKIKKKTFELTIQLLENIIFFADSGHKKPSEKKDANRGIFLLSKQDDKLFLTAGNFIQNSKTLILRNKINILNNTKSESLVKIKEYMKMFYPIEISGKPDVSLIDMKVKSENTLNYSFFRLDDSHSFFTLQVVI